jgi:hypothetical protein
MRLIGGIRGDWTREAEMNQQTTISDRARDSAYVTGSSLVVDGGHLVSSL